MTKDWAGRVDGVGPAHRRFHSIVSMGENHRAAEPAGEAGGRVDVALLGFRSDEGVRRNQGRPGAADGPAHLRRALASLAVHEDRTVRDDGDIVVVGADLDGAQTRLGEALARSRTTARASLVLGGGHETSWGSYLGLVADPNLRGRRLGILNLDAHFDLRAGDEATSGTPFRQIADHCAAHGRDFRYAVVGISEANNTPALFECARDLRVDVLTDEDAQDTPTVLGFVDRFLADVDDLYLTIDLDALPPEVAPGVSAPSSLGVPTATALAVCAFTAAAGKLTHLDVVELNPALDVDGRTARVAARLIHRAVTTLPR